MAAGDSALLLRLPPSTTSLEPSTASDVVAGKWREHFLLLQVDCAPPGNIQAEVVNYRVDNGGFIAVALLEVRIFQSTKI